MRASLFISLSLVATISFAQDRRNDRRQFFDSSIKVDENNVPLKPNTFYFPESLIPDFRFTDEAIDSTSVLLFPSHYKTNSLDSTKTHVPARYRTSDSNTPNLHYLEWFSEQLFDLNEPLLYNLETKKETYRFTWLRSFDHPIVLRFEIQNGEAWLYSKVGKGAGGYEPQGLKTSKKRKLSSDATIEFLRLFEVLDFWNQENVATLPGADGSKWILECSTPTQYSMNYKSSPSAKSDFYKVCRLLMELSNIQIKKSNIY